MEKYSSLEQITFADVYQFIEKKNNDKLNRAISGIFGAGALLFPVYMANQLGISAEVVNTYATGATLAGAGIGKIVLDALKGIGDLFPKKAQYKDKCMQMQITNFLCLYAAFFDAVEECVIVEGCDIWEKYSNSFWDHDRFIEYEKDPDDYMFVEEVDAFDSCSIENFYLNLTQEFQKQFYHLDFWQDLGENCSDQKVFFDAIFRSIPQKAREIHSKQLYELSENFPSLRNWVIQYGMQKIRDHESTISAQVGAIDRKIDNIPDTMSRFIVDTVAKNKDLFHRHGEQYYTFFGDGKCKVNEMFLLNVYKNGSIEPNTEMQGISSVEEIMDIAAKQRLLLIAGAYGTGKTTLLKAIHRKYRFCGTSVYTFDALELAEYIDKNSSSKFIQFFENIAVDGETVILIDAIDDLNIPNEADSEDSILHYFIDNLFDCRERCPHLTFIISSRMYTNTIEDEGNLIVDTCYSYAPKSLSDMRVIYSVNYKSEDVSKWIDSYPFEPGDDINKSEIKDRNGKIINALYNPLFLYVFIKKYEEVKHIKTNEGYYYYYEHFIDQTIKGKYQEENRYGANVIREHSRKYRQLLRQISFDILSRYSNTISDVIDEKHLMTSEPLLAETLQRYRFFLPLEEFSETTRAYYSEMKSQYIDNANFINCYFLRMINNQVFFTDANILFVLAAEKIYEQLWGIVKRDSDFSVSDLRCFDVIDFYPQILDYILYKIKAEKRKDQFRKYANSFVLNSSIRDRIVVLENSNKSQKEILAQVIMLYIIFLKLYRGNYIGNGYQHVFREMMHYINAYKTHCYNEKSVSYVYTIERYLMNTTINELTLKRTNLKSFNFKKSTISKCNFIQCKFNDTIFTEVRFQGKNRFELCEFSHCNFDVSNNSGTNEVSFYDCTFKSFGFRPKECRFIRCFIHELRIDLSNMKKVRLDDCCVDKIVLVNPNCDSNSTIQFSNCIFKNNIDITNYNGYIEFFGKNVCISEGALLRNPKSITKIKDISRVV